MNERTPLATILDAIAPDDQRAWLALHGRLVLDADPSRVRTTLGALIAGEPDRFLLALRDSPALLARLSTALTRRPHPGRSEALRAVAVALGRPLPAVEYALPEALLEGLLERARAAAGKRLRTRGAARHKGRVGDALERLLLGCKVPGRASDHPAAEIKSVPVCGDRIVERVKLGVLSARSDPLAKCDRVLFVFVEQRGDDHFVRGHRLAEFDRLRWSQLWRDGYLVETAAGSPRQPARGLYLTPRWFRDAHLWP